MAVAESGSALQNRGILTALRAAAVLIIATGLNDVIAGAVPRYEPLYLYLAAIAFVVWLDGVLLGALTAIGAVAFYALLFMPRESALSVDVLLPLGEALAVVIVIGIARGLIRARRRATTAEIFPRAQAQVLLPPATTALDQTEVLQAIEDLREELRERETTLRNALRMAEEENSRLARLADAERGERMHLETAAREQAASLVLRVAELETSARHRFDTVRAEGDALRVAADELRVRALRAEEALAASSAEFKIDLGKAIEEREAARVEVRGMVARLHAIEQELAASRTAQQDLEQQLATAQVEQEESERASMELGTRLDDELSTSRLRVTELEQQLLDAITSHEEASRTIADTRARNEKLAQARIALMSEASELRSRVQVLEAEVSAATVRQTELEVAAVAAAAEFDQKLLTITTHLAQDHEADLGKAIEEREAARAELRGTTARMHALEQESAQLQQSLADERAQREEQLQVASAEGRSLMLRVHELEEQLAQAQTARATADREFDEKLNTIVTHLAEDHEADLGKALEDKEEARAEVRSLGMRLALLQKKYDEQRERLAEIEKARASTNGGVVRPRVLIAHPDADLRMSARASLERAGYEILSAGDGLEALRTANLERPDVVIADAVMPKMDGRELCQLLKSQEKTAHIRVILLTRANDDLSKGDLPPDGVLRKPVPLEMLKSTLASLLPADRRLPAN